MDLLNHFRRSTQHMARIPWMFDSLRYFLEGGFREHHAMLGRQLPFPPQRVLDCGCGTGVFAEHFDASSYLGVDLSADYIARARACHPNHVFEVMDARHLNLPANSFDVVLICGVLHHLDDQTVSEVLAETQRVLTPNGLLLLWEDVPTRSPSNRLGRLVHQLDVGDHIRLESDYMRLLASHFTVQSTEPLLSGWMDYTVIRCQPKPARLGAPLVPGPITSPITSLALEGQGTLGPACP